MINFLEIERVLLDEYYSYYYHSNFGWGGVGNGYYLGELFTTTQKPDMPGGGENYGYSGDYDFTKRFKSLFITPSQRK